MRRTSRRRGSGGRARSRAARVRRLLRRRCARIRRRPKRLGRSRWSQSWHDRSWHGTPHPKNAHAARKRVRDVHRKTREAELCPHVTSRAVSQRAHRLALMRTIRVPCGGYGAVAPLMSRKVSAWDLCAIRSGRFPPPSTGDGGQLPLPSSRCWPARRLGAASPVRRQQLPGRGKGGDGQRPRQYDHPGPHGFGPRHQTNAPAGGTSEDGGSEGSGGSGGSGSSSGSGGRPVLGGRHRLAARAPAPARAATANGRRPAGPAERGRSGGGAAVPPFRRPRACRTARTPT